MIHRMAAWLNDHGYPTDLTKPGYVIWGIDRHYPGGFNGFARTRQGADDSDRRNKARLRG